MLDTFIYNMKIIWGDNKKYVFLASLVNILDTTEIFVFKKLMHT